jgi:hypothetical protein
VAKPLRVLAQAETPEKPSSGEEGRSRSRADLDHDRMLLLALVKDIEIVGEAASRVSAASTSECDRHSLARHCGDASPLIHIVSRLSCSWDRLSRLHRDLLAGTFYRVLVRLS